jgi:MoxR-like ATPase
MKALNTAAPAAVQAPRNVDEALRLLEAGEYVADRSLATAVLLALQLHRPLFLEGEAGVGKTEIAKVLAGALGRQLIRLQCYEGLDVAAAAYEWNYPRQMLEIRLAEATQESRATLDQELFSQRFLIQRPLLRALMPDTAGPPVLLIDELDRADEPFEAFLLETLADFQMTIPELGSVRAPAPPIVVITSNRTREIHDAIKRRCFYYWVDYPDAARELAIVRLKAPRAAETLAREVVAFVQKLRQIELYKLPGVAETIDWANALVALDKTVLDPATINDTLGALLKYQDDIARIRGGEAGRLLGEVRAEAAARPAL